MFSIGIDNIYDNYDTVALMLKVFSVGTQNQKNILRGAPDPNLLRPIIKLPNKFLASLEQMMIYQLKRK